MKRIMLVEDDKQTLETLSGYLSIVGYEVVKAANGKEALEKIHNHPLDLILMDLRLPVMNGFEAIKRIRELESLPFIPIIAVSALDQYKDIQRAIDLGADEYVVKPIEEKSFLARIKAMLRIKEALLNEILEEEKSRVFNKENSLLMNCLLSEELDNPEAFSDIITMDPQMRSIFKFIELMAKNSEPALIEGETGVGKELCARAIHTISGRQGKFIPVNIAAIEDNAFADTLFGHVKGAFTGADQDRKGLIETAETGTIFFDEIGEAGPWAQIKLLRLLQEGEYYPLGSDEPKEANARIILATNSNLGNLMAEGRFRADLYFRLRIQEIYIPPLRDRYDDIPLLLDHFLEKASKKLRKKKPTPPDDLKNLLDSYYFPGNIREMENLIFEAVHHHKMRILSMDIFKAHIESEKRANYSINKGKPLSHKDLLCLLENYPIKKGRFPSLREVEMAIIEEAMDLSHGNQRGAAKMLGMSRPTLSRRLRGGSGVED